MSSTAPFPGAPGTRTGNVLRNKYVWAGFAGALFVTGGLLKITGVLVSETVNMGSEAGVNNSDVFRQGRNEAADRLRDDSDEDVPTGNGTLTDDELEQRLGGTSTETDSSGTVAEEVGAVATTGSDVVEFVATDPTGVWPAIRGACGINDDAAIGRVIDASGLGRDYTIPAGETVDLSCGAGR